MKRNPFKKIENLKRSITLSSHEKEEVFFAIENFIKDHPLEIPATLITSPYAFVEHLHRIRYYGAFATACLMLASVSFAAEYTAPGDILYPLKINVNEKVIETSAFTSTSKARVQTSLAERRLIEIEHLATTKGKVDTKSIEQTGASLEKHTQKAISHIKDTSEKGDSISSAELSLELKAVLDTHDTILDFATSSASSVAPIINEIKESVKDDKEIIDAHIDVVKKDVLDKKEELKEKIDTTLEKVAITQEKNNNENVKPLVEEAKENLAKDELVEAFIKSEEAEAVPVKEEKIKEAEHVLNVTIPKDIKIETLNATSSTTTASTTIRIRR